VRTDDEGIIWKAYENDGVPFARDADQAIEGLRMCREWDIRARFDASDRLSPSYQYLDTPAGTFWNVTQLEADATTGRFNALTAGVGWEDARYFRGRNTEKRSVSRCPDGDCCRRATFDNIPMWRGRVWQMQGAHSYMIAVSPARTYSIVDMADVHEFLERQPL
jgi:hypothetical protein